MEWLSSQFYLNVWLILDQIQPFHLFMNWTFADLYEIATQGVFAPVAVGNLAINIATIMVAYTQT